MDRVVCSKLCAVQRQKQIEGRLGPILSCTWAAPARWSRPASGQDRPQDHSEETRSAEATKVPTPHSLLGVIQTGTKLDLQASDQGELLIRETSCPHPAPPRRRLLLRPDLRLVPGRVFPPPLPRLPTRAGSVPKTLGEAVLLPADTPTAPPAAAGAGCGGRDPRCPSRPEVTAPAPPPTAAAPRPASAPYRTSPLPLLAARESIEASRRASPAPEAVGREAGAEGWRCCCSPARAAAAATSHGVKRRQRRASAHVQAGPGPGGEATPAGARLRQRPPLRRSRAGRGGLPRPPPLGYDNNAVFGHTAIVGRFTRY